MWPIESQALGPSDWCGTTNRLTSSGVTKMPIRVEAEALHTAAATLPRAIEVKAIDDCTVAGNMHKKSTPRYRSAVTSGANTGLSASPSIGNRIKVLANTSKCNRQWVAPATMAWRESLAPCRKNSRPMATPVRVSKKGAIVPRTGQPLASVTVATRASVKLSGK